MHLIMHQRFMYQAVAAPVRAIKGVTSHPYGLGAVDKVVGLLAF